MPLKQASPSAEEAEELAIQVLGWLVQDAEMMRRFLALSGIEPGAIRQAAQEPGFYPGVTGFLMAHEPTLMAFCASADLKPEHVVACHQVLIGPESHSWT